MQCLTELALKQTQHALCCPEGLFLALPSEMWVGGAGIHPWLKGSYGDDGANLYLVVPDSVMEGHGRSLDNRKKIQ